ncbi:hypothetical protein FACS1894200_09420 [Spirochaetia bacterium]|nr:hypothetical protein FACS1894200_09420 [Spirochaetia bacterium]
MTKEERAAERKAYRENIAEVNEWKRKAQARTANMTLAEKAAYYDAFVERLRTQYGINLVFPEQPAKTDKG